MIRLVRAVARLLGRLFDLILVGDQRHDVIDAQWARFDAALRQSQKEREGK